MIRIRRKDCRLCLNVRKKKKKQFTTHEKKFRFANRTHTNFTQIIMFGNEGPRSRAAGRATSFQTLLVRLQATLHVCLVWMWVCVRWNVLKTNSETWMLRWIFRFLFLFNVHCWLFIVHCSLLYMHMYIFSIFPFLPFAWQSFGHSFLDERWRGFFSVQLI